MSDIDEERLEPIHLRLVPALMVTIEETADEHVGFLGPPVPGAETEAFEAVFAVHRISNANRPAAL